MKYFFLSVNIYCTKVKITMKYNQQASYLFFIAISLSENSVASLTTLSLGSTKASSMTLCKENRKAM